MVLFYFYNDYYSCDKTHYVYGWSLHKNLLEKIILSIYKNVKC